MKIGRKTLTQRARSFLSRPLRWFGKPLGKLAKPLGRLAKPLGKIDGIERPAVYLGFAFVLWRLWMEKERRRRPLRLAVQDRLASAARRRAQRQDHDEPRANL